MSTDAAITFTTMLTVLSLAALGGLGLLAAAATVSAPAGRLWHTVRASIAEQRLWLAFVVAAVATAGSLYFSESAGFIPCRYCWFQRIAMYPIAVVTLVAALRRDDGARWYGATLAAVGAPISAWHYLLERYPSLDTGACDPAVPCTLVWFERLGFVTLPFMALTAFALIATVLPLPAPKET